MSASLQKKVRVRMARCTDQMVALTSECREDELPQLEAAIDRLRALSIHVDQLLAPAPTRLARPAPSRPPAPPSNPGLPPVYGPSTGVREAPLHAPKSWLASDGQRTADELEDDDMPVARPANDDELISLMIAGTAGGIYEGEAARTLAARDNWDWMKTGERLAAIRTLARELEDQAEGMPPTPAWAPRGS